MQPRQYTEHDFRAALDKPDTRTIADLCRALGIVPRGGNYETVRAYGRRLDLDADLILAWRRLECSDDQLAAVASGVPPDAGMILTTLGISDTCGNRQIVRERIHQLGLSAAVYERSLTDEQLRVGLADPDVDSYGSLCEVLRLRPLDHPPHVLRERALRLGMPLPDRWFRRDREPVPFRVDELREAVTASYSLAATIRALGETPSRSTYYRVRRQIRQDQIETSHFKPNGRRRRRPIESVLVYGPLKSTTTLRLRLLAEGLKDHQCDGCNLEEWKGHPIPLELDHVDGDRRNNRFENLRLLCPNCHALTPTYRGRNIRNGDA